MSPPGAHASTRSVDMQRPLRARKRCRSGVLRSLASAGPHCAPPSSACDLQRRLRTRLIQGIRHSHQAFV